SAPSSNVKLLVGLLCVCVTLVLNAPVHPISNSFAKVVELVVPVETLVTPEPDAVLYWSTVPAKPEYSQMLTIPPPPPPGPNTPDTLTVMLVPADALTAPIQISERP